MIELDIEIGVGIDINVGVDKDRDTDGEEMRMEIVLKTGMEMRRNNTINQCFSTFLAVFNTVPHVR